MKAGDYIRRKDNARITAIVIYPIGPERILVRGPFREMTERSADWEKVTV